VEILKDAMTSVSRIRNFEKESSILNIGTSVFEEPNVLIELNKETSVDGLYGFKKRANKIAFYVDEPDMLLELLK
jgi:hypothetical protein